MATVIPTLWQAADHLRLSTIYRFVAPQHACCLVYTADSSSLLQLTCVCLAVSDLICVKNKVIKEITRESTVNTMFKLRRYVSKCLERSSLFGWVKLKKVSNVKLHGIT